MLEQITLLYSGCFRYKRLEVQAVRWMEWIQEYNFTVEHRKLRVHSSADALWKQLQTLRESWGTADWGSERHQSAAERLLEFGALTKDQLEGPDISDLVKSNEEGIKQTWSEISGRSSVYKSYWAQSYSLQVCNGVLCRAWGQQMVLWSPADGAAEEKSIPYVKSAVCNATTLSYTIKQPFKGL